MLVLVLLTRLWLAVLPLTWLAACELGPLVLLLLLWLCACCGGWYDWR